MAKTQQPAKPVTPNFKDVDKEATARAAAAVAGGRQDPLNVPKGAKVSTDAKGVQYSRWSERVVITGAYRTVTKKGLMDVTVVAKVRQSDENDGARVFGHYYLNMSDELPKGHDEMNDRSIGAIKTLLESTGTLKNITTLRGSVLDKMFPPKNQPGSASPLVDKTAVANIVQQLGPQKDQKTNKPVLDDDGEPILEKRDNIESFLPDAPAGEEEEGS